MSELFLTSSKCYDTLSTDVILTKSSDSNLDQSRMNIKFLIEK